MNLLNRFPVLCVSTALLLGVCSGGAAIGMLPEQKVGIEVPAEERNPFAKRGPGTATTIIQDTESEESRLRGILESMPISGFADGPGERRVLLGPFPLTVGRQLPPVIEKQTEALVVRAIEAGRVELAFVERDNRPETRFVVLRFNLNPEVRFQLGTQAVRPQENTAAAGLGGSLRTETGEAGQTDEATDDDTER